MDDREKIARKLRNMQKYVEFLKSYRSIPTERLEEDYELRSAIERNLQLAIESSLDIGEYLIAARGLRKPETYREVLEILGEAGILPEEFAARFSEAAKFRTILVHMYAEVDLEMLCEILHSNLLDFDEFARYIVRYLEQV
ncbi:MAG: DUF86 domain-containing protein [Methanomicrobia archaeon]|nr:DUF86 domain-containing protein [Methanomicrobia archaeon]